MNQTDATSGDPFLDFDRVGMATRRTGAFRLTDVTPTGIQWLWPERIPFGYVTLLVSDPGAGKSLVALDVAARVSTGRSWPDEERGARSERSREQESAFGSQLPAPSSLLSALCSRLRPRPQYRRSFRKHRPSAPRRAGRRLLTHHWYVSRARRRCF